MIHEKYMLEHKNEFELLDYADLRDNTSYFFKTMINGKWSYCDEEANAKEG